ncbi:agmatine deiminase family protein [Stieleria sp. TO1_6]|uniref:agmatine deiminase family protein n=1 Tax=Stieleria tagensis TaxID=2956795 RepID=UPI00209B1200|nr:agmatine deiminase family protein [Stieleria tagensis]MCO8121789.1 agmatine deiminase family protein [Stieleria tagensis]
MAQQLIQRSNYFLFFLAVVTVLSVAVAGYTTKELGSTSRRLDEFQLALGQSKKDQTESANKLGEADQFLISAIRELDRAQEDFIGKAARQLPPSNDFSATKLDLKKRLMSWIESTRERADLVAERALAHYRLGQLASLEGNQIAAKQALTKAIALAAEGGDQRLVGSARNTLGCSLAQLGETKRARDEIQTSVSLFRTLPSQPISLALALRNAGTLSTAANDQGKNALVESIKILRALPDQPSLTVATEILVDTQMAWGQQLFEKGRYDQSESVCQSARDLLAEILPLADNHNLGSDIAPRSIRYRSAIAMIDHDLAMTRKHTCATWRWSPLVDLVTETVALRPELKTQAVAEFAPQTGIVLPWGTYQWTHDPVLQIARATHDRWRIEVLADNDDSLDDAMTAFADAEIPITNVRFGVQPFEVPWFRDTGPLVAATSQGTTVWFDSHQSRFDNFQRPVNDALPKLIATRWESQVIPTPLHIEGGTLLSNGQGLTIVSKTVIEDNLQYGFELEEIKQELQRVTGASQLLPVPPLIGELTGHVDLFMTFTDPGTLVLSQPDQPGDDNRKMLDHLAEQLATVQVNGQALKIVRIPMRAIENGFANSYTNVIFANGVLLVPSYNAAATEQEVKATYERLLPDWEIKLIDCSWLATKGGALHCLGSNLGPTPHVPLRSN